MKIIKTEGLVLKKTDFSEADRIMTVFTRESGKKIITANGIRKSNKRDKYGTDVLVVSEFIYYDKEERVVLSGVELKEPFIELKKDIKKINIVIYLLVILDDVIMEGVQRKAFYDFTVKTIKYISKNSNNSQIFLSVLNFLIRLAEEEGIMFENGAGEFLNVEDGKIEETKGDKYIRVESKNKEIIDTLINCDNVKIKQFNSQETAVFETILIVEKYINYNLNLKINIKEFIKEAI